MPDSQAPKADPKGGVVKLTRWDPGGDLIRWQEKKAREMKEFAEKASTRTPSPAAEPAHGEHHWPSHYGFKWASTIADEIMWKKEDSTWVKIAKTPLLLLSPIVLGPVALLGEMFDEINLFTGVDLGTPIDTVGKPIWRPIDVPATIGVLDPKVSDTSSFGPSDGHASRSTHVAHETVPPIPPEKPVDRQRESNKCNARGGRR